MGDKTRRGSGHDGRFRLVDFLVVLFCLSGAAFSINLFRVDLLQTLDSQNEEPVGTIIIKNNVVQRRHSDRVLWDRLMVNSPAYSGDLIRTAELSEATLLIDDNSIDMSENTLIRIQRFSGRGGAIQIDLDEGAIGLVTRSGDRSIMLNLMGRQIEAAPGTVLSASAGKDGMVLSVSEGTATFVGEQEGIRKLFSGAMLALDASGSERTEPAVVVMYPRPNARYLKIGSEPLNIDFVWNHVNIEPGDDVRLEIAEDRNFTRIFRVMDGLDASAQPVFDAGTWHWRLSRDEAVLGTGRFSVVEAVGPEPVSPATDSLFRYQDSPPQIRFQWPKVEEATSYVFEILQTPESSAGRTTEGVESTATGSPPDSLIPWRSMQTTATFVIDSNLGPGTWYWRVKPVFPSVYEGNSAFSSASVFHIEQSSSASPVMVLPELVTEEPEPPPPPVSPAETGGRSSPPLASPAETGGRGSPSPVFSAEAEGRGAPPPVSPVETGGRGSPPEQVIPLLAAPANRQPAAGHHIGIEQLRRARHIVFTWSAVQGANAYIFTLHHETANGRRQIIHRPPENITSWTLDNLRMLDRGSFVWQVEAVNIDRNGTIERRGRIEESTFIIDIPRPAQVQLEHPGTLYGN